ncbi:MAG: electron transport complex subunit RsxC [Pseudomonadota bacterium]
MSWLDIFRRHKTFPHGIYPLEHKEITAGKAIRRLPFPPELVVPLSQHIGKPARPVVRVGQEVVRGQLIAEADGYVSVPMHAPATGQVTAIDLCATVQGPKTTAVYIKVYAAATQAVVDRQARNLAEMTPDGIVTAVQESGIVGLGGAAFPSHVKMRPPEGRTIETVIGNGAECEPYLTCDHRLMLEKTDALITGVTLALRATGAKRAIIGVEDNKMDAVAVIREHLPADLPITVEAVRTKYPQGAEKMLIKSLLDREVPSGGLPADVGAAVYNVGTLAQMGELLPSGYGLIERVVTVSGPGVTNPGNFLVPVGTPLRFLLDHVGVSDDANEVIVGGPMMGMSAASLDVSVTKAVSGVVVLETGDETQSERQVYPCIQCGRCLEACPIHLNPSALGQLAQSRDYASMADKFHLNDCFECGSCAYVCPSNIPLTQYFRIAKSINREAAA